MYKEFKVNSQEKHLPIREGFLEEETPEKDVKDEQVLAW